MSQKKYQTIFFDLDHTLWDFDANARIALKTIYEQFNFRQLGIQDFKHFSKTYEYHNDLFWERFRKGWVDREALRWKRLWHTFIDYRIFHKALAKEASETYLSILPHQTILLNHTMDVLEYCHSKGYELAIITNGFKDTQELKVEKSGIAHYFQHMITSEDVQWVKPHREIFDKAMEIMQTAPEKSLMIGDSLEADVMGAAALNMDQVFFNPKKLHHTYHPTYEISCLSQIKEIL